ncbi:chemotaxis protein CheB [Luteibaculum oceani]|uniref:Chemotaxis protein CheR n=1 Tax=Luteibaculum oceani TaxID=1294296 RepID=A0A5C6V273_9FLAO|nr:chemotaxis protein CheB [Luteibaculum oceani]TXC78536.1 hypothetical protein FRX97_07395 [Luteibaculum oceani]
MKNAKSEVKSSPKNNKSKTPKSPEEDVLQIVAIGASAGGLQAIYSFIDNIGSLSERNTAFVIIQHLSPDYKSLMPELLRRHTEMEIVPIEDGQQLERGKVYVAQPSTVIRVEEGVLKTVVRQQDKSVHYPINSFLVSLANDQGEKAIAVILSGSGSDGTLGIEQIKQKGGFVVAQDEETASFNGMPSSAISTGLVDKICPPEDIAKEIANYLDGVSEDFEDDEIMDSAGPEVVVNMILASVNKHFDLDFTLYKKNTILRRIERRMKAMSFSKMRDYMSYLQAHPQEAKNLGNDFLINVTAFCRDPEAFAYLEEFVLPATIADFEDSDQLRVWVVGCSRGQEAYSLAIIFKRYLDKFHPGKSIKIFATDVHAPSVSYASKGRYAIEEIESLPKEYVNKYFNKLDDQSYQVKSTLRDLIVFAVHNIIKDPPFNNIHFVSCRNLLIYFKAELQQKVLGYLHFSLVPGGRLFLGLSEAPFSKENNFETINTNFRLYRKVSNNRTKFYLSNTPKSGVSRITNEVSSNGKLTAYGGGRTRVEEPRIIDRIKDQIIDEVLPPTVIVNSENDIVHVFGDVEDYLHFPKKQFHLNIFKMVPDSLYLPINTLIVNVKKAKERVVFNNVNFQKGEERKKLKISAFPVENHQEGIKSPYTGIIFEADTEIPMDQIDFAGMDLDKDQHVRILQLEEELKETQEFLQNTIEELETSNEELQATNEELIASNEELQSTNEELQSVNEELYSVNTEFQVKVTEMVEINDDLNNLIQSTEIGTIFLDRYLNIRKFTDAVAEIINLSENDIGRPISDLKTKLVDVEIETLSNEVLKKLEPVEIDVLTKNNSNFLMRMVPYRSSENKIDGVVITFVNTDRLKTAETELRSQTKKLQRSNSELEQVAYVATHDLRGPVINMKGLLDIHIKKQEFSEDDEVIRRLRSNVNRIISTLDGLIEVISYQKDLSSEFEKVDLEKVVSDIFEEYKDELNSYKGKFKKNLKVTQAFGIKRYYYSILKNLVGNAIKYRQEVVPLLIDITSKKLNEDFMELTITDNGIGMDMKYVDSAFTAFSRLTSKGDGKGIGLYLVRSMVESMEGAVTFESEENSGTKFIITLPINDLKRYK